MDRKLYCHAIYTGVRLESTFWLYALTKQPLHRPVLHLGLDKAKVEQNCLHFNGRKVSHYNYSFSFARALWHLMDKKFMRKKKLYSTTCQWMFVLKLKLVQKSIKQFTLSIHFINLWSRKSNKFTLISNHFDSIHVWAVWWSIQFTIL